MNVKQVMSEKIAYITAETSIAEAAKRMKQLDCGFLPVADVEADKLCGVVTDRDICVRAVAEGMDVKSTHVDSILSDQVLYCFANDSLQEAAQSMHDQGVSRLVVLDNPQDKRLCGIISLGDIVRCGETQLAAKASEGIMRQHAA